MSKLSKLLPLLPPPRMLSDLIGRPLADNVEISGITDHSDKVRPGDAYLCLPRAAHQIDVFGRQALDNGAAAVVALKNAPQTEFATVRIDDMEAMGMLLRRWFDTVNTGVRCIGVTGTDGKTSIAWMLRQALMRKAGKAWGLGTLGLIRDEGRIDDVGNTTPSLLTLHHILAAAGQQGIKALVMEVSSHGIEQQRIAGLPLQTVIWTNLGHDHLQDHGGFEAYASLKLRFAGDVAARGGTVICNADSDEVVRRVNEADIPVLWYAHGLYHGDSEHIALAWEQELPGLLRIAHGGKEVVIEDVPAGEFHAENLAAVALALCTSFATGIGKLPGLLTGITAPPGRMQPLESGRWQVFIDYAHTPEALQRCLETTRKLTRGRLIVVFGCGGERDREKRPAMGGIAAALADVVWLTSDNPRGELPEVIASEIESGMPQPYPAEVHLELDRERAISQAVAAMQPEDTLVIAGKGHENYMEIGHHRLPWSDFDIAGQAVHAREAQEVQQRCA